MDLLKVLVIILVLGYIGINFVAPLPLFLTAENIFYAISYSYLLYQAEKGAKWAYPAMLVLAAFNAGRVSRSLVTPYGTLGPLWLQHVPLELLVLVVALLAYKRTVDCLFGGKC